MSKHQITANLDFQSDDDCLRYLAKIKWPTENFVCRKCGNQTYSRGRSPYSRRCNRCKYDESVTSGTMFHRLRFPLLKAFDIIRRFANQDNDNSLDKLSELYGLQTKTCAAFIRKVRKTIGDLRHQKLDGKVLVCYYELMQEESYSYLWRHWKIKQRIAVAAEVRKKQIVRAYATVIDDEKAKYLRPFMERCINPGANILMIDAYGIKVLQKQFKSLEFLKPTTTRLRLLHEYFIDMRRWLNTEHRNCSYKHMQEYLDEYCFRFDRRHNSSRHFETIVRAMMKNVGEETESTTL